MYAGATCTPSIWRTIHAVATFNHDRVNYLYQTEVKNIYLSVQGWNGNAVALYDNAETHYQLLFVFSHSALSYIVLYYFVNFEYKHYSPLS